MIFCVSPVYVWPEMTGFPFYYLLFSAFFSPPPSFSFYFLFLSTILLPFHRFSSATFLPHSYFYHCISDFIVWFIFDLTFYWNTYTVSYHRCILRWFQFSVPYTHSTHSLPPAHASRHFAVLGPLPHTSYHLPFSLLPTILSSSLKPLLSLLYNSINV